MSLDLNRRELLLAGAAAWLGAPSLARAMAPQPKGRDQEGPLLHQELRIRALRDRPARRQAVARRRRSLPTSARRAGFEVVASKDGRMFEPDQIGQWDVFVFRDHRRPDDSRTATRTRRSPPKAKRHSTTPSAPARASWACTAQPTPSATSHPQQGSRRSLHPDDRRRVHHPRRPAGVQDRNRRPRVSGSQQRIRQGRKIVHDQRRMVRAQTHARRSARHPLSSHRGDEGQHVPAAQLPDDLGAGVRQGARLLHLDGPPRRRLVEPDVPGAPAGCPRLVVRPRRSQHRAEFPEGDAEGQRASHN